MGEVTAIEAIKDQETYQRDFDVKAISGLVHSINMAASKLTAYPQGHPAIDESFGRAEAIAKGILDQCGQLSFGVARDSLMIGNRVLDEKNVIFRRFARILFEHGIVGLTLQRGITAQELMDFDLITSQKRNDVYRAGGINALISKARVRHVQLKLIDYALFQAEEDLDCPRRELDDLETTGFWEGFVKRLFEGTLEAPDVSRPSEDLNPEIIAEMLNEKYITRNSEALAGLDFALLVNIQNPGVETLSSDADARRRLFEFTGSLNPDLCQCFLERFLNSLPEDKDTAEMILSGLSEEIILEALQKQINDELYVPPNVINVLRKLKRNAVEEKEQSLSADSRENVTEKLHTIFKEDENDKFVPADYQQILKNVMVAEDLSADDFTEVHQLGKTLSSYNIQIGISPVLVNLVTAHVNDELPEVLKTALKQHCTSLAESGDFHIIANILEAIDEQIGSCGENENRILDELYEMFSLRDFIEAILNAGAKWGKEKNFYLKKIVQHIGRPFIEPLLDRLAEEESKSLRLFYLELLANFGSTIKEQLIDRLGDKRWYVVRNLLYVLRQLDDPSVLTSIYRLFNHQDQRVRHELLLMFLSFKDPRGDTILLQEMNSGDTARCLKAISIADMTDNTDVFSKLVDFVKKRGFKKHDVEIRKESIRILASIKNPAVLPAFKKILKSSSLFSRQKLLNLKLEVIASLPHYAGEEIYPMLKSIADSRSGELASKARTILKSIKGKQK